MLLRKVNLILVILFFHNQLLAQYHGVIAAEIQKTNKDANTFLYNYMQPAFEGLMSATNSGWSTSAASLKPFHVELNISIAAALVPQEKETFIFNNTDYNNVKIDSGPNILPTLLGGEAKTKLKIIYEDNAHNQTKLYEFDAPSGIKEELDLPANIVPGPNIQLSVGLPLGFETGIRYLPKLTSEEGGYLQILGLAVKHNVSQYLNNNKTKDDKKKHLNLAFQASYQNISTGWDDFDSDKAVEMKLNAFSGQFIASYDYKFISFYSSLGYTKSFSLLNILGTYEYTYTLKDRTTGVVIGSETFSIKNPIDLDFNLSGVKAKLGIKLKLFVLSLHVDYTIQEYSVFNAGIGIKI